MRIQQLYEAKDELEKFIMDYGSCPCKFNSDAFEGEVKITAQWYKNTDCPHKKLGTKDLEWFTTYNCFERKRIMAKQWEQKRALQQGFTHILNENYKTRINFGKPQNFKTGEKVKLVNGKLGENTTLIENEDGVKGSVLSEDLTS